MDAYPSILDAQKLQRLQAPLPPDAVMTSVAPTLPAPTLPTVTQAPAPPNPIQNTNTRLLGDQAELQRLGSTGSGVSQIKNPLLRALARVGDTAESIIAPGAAEMTPGTTLHNLFLQREATGRVNNDLANQGELAKTGQTEANTAYLAARPDIEQSKIDQRQTAVQERVGQAAAAKGQLVKWDENGIPTFTDDHTSQAFADHQALSAMHQATADKSAILADIQKNHYIPGTPEWQEAQKKIAQVDQRLRVAMGSLGLRAQGLELRKENQQANLYGTDLQGTPIPGAPQLESDDGNLQTVGLRAGNLAVKQQGKVTSFNDLQGSAAHARQALDALHASGADLSDPDIVMAMSDPTTIAGKVINGKFVKANLTPQKVQAIGAINQLREQIGIMRSSTGGPAAEAQAQRMLSALPEGGDAKNTAINKMDELNGVIDRLRPGAVHVAGGAKVTGQGPSATMTATGPNGHKIMSSDGGRTWLDAKTGTVVK